MTKNQNWQTTPKIVREFRRLLRAQTPQQKQELRKSLLAAMERERRKIN
jgi:hypothetical protein